MKKVILLLVLAAAVGIIAAVRADTVRVSAPNLQSDGYSITIPAGATNVYTSGVIASLTGGNYAAALTAVNSLPVPASAEDKDTLLGCKALFNALAGNSSAALANASAISDAGLRINYQLLAYSFLLNTNAYVSATTAYLANPTASGTVTHAVALRYCNYLSRTGASKRAISDVAVSTLKQISIPVKPALFDKVDFTQYANTDNIAFIRTLISNAVAAGVTDANADYIGKLQSRLAVYLKLQNP